MNSRGLTNQEIREFTHPEGSFEDPENIDNSLRSMSNTEGRQREKILSQRKQEELRTVYQVKAAKQKQGRDLNRDIEKNS